MVAKIFLERTTDEWLSLLEQADIPCMPLHTLESIFEDPHLQAVGLFQWEDHPSEGRMRRVGVPSSWSGSQPVPGRSAPTPGRSEEHTSELQSLMRISYAVFCLKNTYTDNKHSDTSNHTLL